MKRILTILLLLLSVSGYSTHVTGNYITYRALDSFVYEIDLVFFRDCQGVAFSNPSSVTAIEAVSNSSQRIPLSLTLVSIEEIHHRDDTNSYCDPPNTYGTGFGTEKHVYRDTIDLNSSSNSFMKNYCELIIRSGQCCRANHINTGPASTNMYNYALIDICKAPENSSVQITDDVETVLCCFEPVELDFHAVDTIDGDSLSFHWGRVLKAYDDPFIGYNSSYSYGHPFLGYYPLGFDPNHSNPSAQIPEGVYLNNETGEVIFTPIRCDEVTVAVIEIKEWKKNDQNQYEHVSSIRVERVFITTACYQNIQPDITFTGESYVCVGDTFDILVETSDKDSILGKNDSTTLFWSESIPGASFTILDSTARFKKGRFYWVPTEQDLRSTHYTVQFTALDNNSPFAAITQRNLHLVVVEKPDPITLIEPISCAEMVIDLDLKDAILVNPQVTWELYNSMNSMDHSSAQLSYSDSTYSFRQQDTLRLQDTGTYYLYSKVGSTFGYYCPAENWDTLDIVQLTTPDSPVLSLNKGYIYSSIPAVDWYLDGTLIGSGLDSIKAQKAGLYKAVNKVSEYCYAESEILSKTTSIWHARDHKLEIFPNPSRGLVYVRIRELNISNTSLRVLDTQGRIVDISVNVVNGHYQLEWDAVPGIYYLQVLTDSGQVMTSALLTY